MAGDDHKRRRAELVALWQSAPAKVIGLYRMTVGLDVLEPLPPGITQAEIVETILKAEFGGRPPDLKRS
jgi:hypothetical protein